MGPKIQSIVYLSILIYCLYILCLFVCKANFIDFWSCSSDHFLTSSKKVYSPPWKDKIKMVKNCNHDFLNPFFTQADSNPESIDAIASTTGDYAPNIFTISYRMNKYNTYLSYLNRVGRVSLLSKLINFKISRKRSLLIVAQNTECEVAGFQILSKSTRFHWKYPRAYHRPMKAFISMISVTFKERYKK